MVTREEAASRTRPSLGTPRPTPPSTPSCCRAGTPGWRQAWPSHIKGSPVPAGPPPARMEPPRGWGRRGRGRARSCRRPPGLVGTRRNVPSSARPPAQRVPLVHPAWLSAKPGAQGGCSEYRQQGTPHLHARQVPDAFCVPTGPGEDLACAGLAHSAQPGTGAHLGSPPAPGRPSSSPPNPRPLWSQAWDHRLSAEGRAGWLHPQPLHTHSPADSPGRPARTDTHQPPARSPAPQPRNAVGGLGRPVQTPLPLD